MIEKNGNPFATIFETVGIPAASHISNFVVIMAATSVYNSSVYPSSHMLYSLAIQKNAPRIFSKLSAARIPYVAVLFSSFCAAIIIVVNMLMLDNSFMHIMAVATAATVITWAIIVITHLKFRKTRKSEKNSFIYAFGLYSHANYFCLCFLALLFCIMFVSGFGQNGLMTQLFDAVRIKTVSVWPRIPGHRPDMSLVVIISCIVFAFTVRVQIQEAILEEVIYKD